MMSRTIVTLLLMIISLTAIAQDSITYQVFRLKGEIYKVMRRERKPLSLHEFLLEKDVIALEQGSELQLVRMKDSTMVTLKDQCAGALKVLINSQKNSQKPMSQRYFAFVKKTLLGKGYKEEMAYGRSTTVYRNDADSLLTNPNVMTADSLLNTDVLGSSCIELAVPMATVVVKEKLMYRVPIMKPIVIESLHHGKSSKAKRK